MLKEFHLEITGNTEECKTSEVSEMLPRPRDA